MKVPFEYWVDENVQRSNSKKLLNEAIICYKAGANRASLLFSYMAFIDIIGTRLLEANRPDEIQQGEWEQKRRFLLDDDETEKAVFDILNRSDNKYFKLSDSIRNQVKYWKDRRNDCAHLKNNDIGAAHVESFWLFIISNLNRFSVIGSQDDILNRIERHYNENYTPLYSDFTQIILDIPYSVDLTNFANFLVEVKKVIKQREEEFWLYFDECANFFHCMLGKLNDQYAELVKNFIYHDSELAEEMFNYNTDFLIYFKDKPQFVRELWKKHIGEINTPKAACILIRNNIIPTNEIEEFIQECVFRNKDSIPKEDDFDFLMPYGYRHKFDEIFKTALNDERSFAWWVKENQKFIKYYLKYNIKKKNDIFIDMIINSYNVPASGEHITSIYSILNSVLQEEESNLSYVKQRADSLNFDIDIFALY